MNDDFNLYLCLEFSQALLYLLSDPCSLALDSDLHVDRRSFDQLLPQMESNQNIY